MLSNHGRILKIISFKKKMGLCAFAFFSLFSIQLTCLLASFSPAVAEEISREEIQAALIIKFTDFIRWPDDSFDDEDPKWFTIAILGDSGYENLFEPFTKRMFQNRKLRILHYTGEQKVGKVQILIVTVSEKRGIKERLDRLMGRPILTIGDFPGFAKKGGIINFYPKPSNRIGFEVNMDAKQRSGIKISSHLLRLATIIKQTSKSQATPPDHDSE